MSNVNSNESGGVFKSAETTPQKFKAGTNSAVSDVAVERAEEPAIAPIERRVEVALQPTTASHSELHRGGIVAVGTRSGRGFARCCRKGGSHRRVDCRT